VVTAGVTKWWPVVDNFILPRWMSEKTEDKPEGKNRNCFIKRTLDCFRKIFTGAEIQAFWPPSACCVASVIIMK